MSFHQPVMSRTDMLSQAGPWPCIKQGLFLLHPLMEQGFMMLSNRALVFSEPASSIQEGSIEEFVSYASDFLSRACSICG